MTEAPRLLPRAQDLLDALRGGLKFFSPAPPLATFHWSSMMDVLSDVLRVVHLAGAVFFTADFSSPWSVESPIPEMIAAAVMPEAECVVLFHILVQGECEVICPS